MKSMKRLRLLSLILHFFVGIGAIFGGSAAILNPEAPLGMPVDVLRMGPFDNFLIPGFFLFTVLGAGPSVIRNSHNSENPEFRIHNRDYGSSSHRMAGGAVPGHAVNTHLTYHILYYRMPTRIHRHGIFKGTE